MPTPLLLTPLLDELAARPEPAVLTTIRADGSPSSSVMWFTVEDGALLLPTKRNRLKVRHIERDPRISVLVLDRRSPGRYVEASGIAELTEHRASTLIYDLAEAYTGSREHAGADDREDLRVVIRLVPERIVGRP